MAWIEEERRFLRRHERKKRIDLLEKYIEKVKKEHNVSNLSEIEDEEVLLEMSKIAKELKKLKRVHRAEVDLLYFSWEYFSEAGNKGNAGNWDGFDLEDVDDAAEFHKEICSIMDHVSNVKTNEKICMAAPRGHAKSTYLSKAFPIREICFRKRKYIIAISITPDVTEKNLEWISLQLKHNQKLREDFGPLLSPKKQENIRDNNEAFIAWHKDKNGKQKMLCLVEATSEGKSLRGRNWNGVRPDLIICDDLEDARINAGTPEQRQKLRDWYTSVVEPLGDPKGKKTAFVYMGTTVAPDCLLMDLLYNQGDYKSKVYRAIIEEPKRQDLWAECEALYKNPDKPAHERAEDARRFYEEHKEEMLEGAKVLWEEAKSLWDLYKWKWDKGSKAFSTEYMNNPIDEETQIFKPDEFTYYEPLNYDFLDHSKFQIFFGIDFAMGKKDRGDYSSLTVLAKSRRTQTLYVVESFCEKLHPDKFLDYIVDRTLYYEPDRIAADSNAAQEFLTYTLRERLRAIGYPSYTRIKEIKDRTKKELRIEAMLPDIVNGHIQFNKQHYRLLEQFETYPQGTHDDAIDSLCYAVQIGRINTQEIVEKPWWM